MMAHKLLTIAQTCALHYPLHLAALTWLHFKAVCKVVAIVPTMLSRHSSTSFSSWPGWPRGSATVIVALLVLPLLLLMPPLGSFPASRAARRLK